MKKIIGLKAAANIALWVILVGSLVFTIGFGTCLYIAREEVTVETDKKVQRDIDYVNSYIDGQLQRYEDAGFGIATRCFGHTVRTEDGTASVNIDDATFVKPTPEQIYTIMEQFLEANPMICGIALGFEHGVYPEVQSQFGFTPYVSRQAGQYRKINVGDLIDSQAEEWYTVPAQTNEPYWCNPFFDKTHNRVITCYNIPVHGFGGRFIGVLSIVIDTDTFSRKCADAAPYPNAVVSIVDRNFSFICHPDSSYILRQVKDIEHYASFKSNDSIQEKMVAGEAGNYTINEGSDQAALFYFTPIQRTGWTIAIECPFEDVYGGVNRMKRLTTTIAIISILIMIACFIWLFRRLQKISITNAGIERELNIASAIQMGMVPKIYPAFPNRKELDICGLIKPAKSVGGDLYDYLIHGNKFYFCIGDVSGKGVPASLFMCVITALFRNITTREDDPARIAEALNAGVAESNDMNMFCTMFIGILDLKTGHLDYCNAGHNAPIIRRAKDGKVDVHYIHPITNLPIGVFDGFPYQSEETTLNPGDAFFLYTDGVTEAENLDKALFGEEATLNALADARKHKARSAQEFVQAVYNTVIHYTAGAEQSDDITMLVVEYKGPDETANA